MDGVYAIFKELIKTMRCSYGLNSAKSDKFVPKCEQKMEALS